MRHSPTRLPLLLCVAMLGCDTSRCEPTDTATKQTEPARGLTARPNAFKGSAISFLRGEPLESHEQVPRSFGDKAGMVASTEGVTLYDGVIKIIGIQYPIHHTQVAVVFLAFENRSDGFRFIARSNALVDAHNHVDKAVVHEGSVRQVQAATTFTVTMRDPGYVYRYDLTWHTGPQKLSAVLFHRSERLDVEADQQ